MNLLQSYLANKSALLSELNTSNAIGSTNLRWTAATWNTFVAARTAAQNTYNDVGASQMQVDAARTALYNARAGLALIRIDMSFTGSWSGIQHDDSWGLRVGYALFYNSGTLTLNTRSNHFDVWMVGGGGGGGGCSGAGDGRSGGGGGGGGYVNLVKNQTVGAGTAAISVGGGGGAGYGTGDWYTVYDGGSGGSSYFNGLGISLSASGGSGGIHSQVWYKGNGGSGGSGGGGGGSGGNGGIGGQNGASGINGQGGGNIGYGGTGSGVNQTIFQENGWYLTASTGPGGIGGCYSTENQASNATQSGYTTWMGAAGIRNGDWGGGGGGACIFNNLFGTAGGNGIVIVRWYD